MRRKRWMRTDCLGEGLRRGRRGLGLLRGVVGGINWGQEGVWGRTKRTVRTQGTATMYWAWSWGLCLDAFPLK